MTKTLHKKVLCLEMLSLLELITFQVGFVLDQVYDFYFSNISTASGTLRDVVMNKQL